MSRRLERTIGPGVIGTILAVLIWDEGDHRRHHHWDSVNPQIVNMGDHSLSVGVSIAAA